MTFDTPAFLAKLANQTFHVGVVGLGYVGLPLSLTFVEQTQFLVSGFDVDAAKVERLRAGGSYIAHLGQERVARALESQRFRPTGDFSLLGQLDAILISVPTPLTAAREPDLTFVVATVEQVARHLRRGQLIVLESTTYPGTTEEVVLPLLEKSGLTCGVDFQLAFSPEREDPGNRMYTTASIPKLVGGVNAESTALAAALYASAFQRVVRVASARVAEAAKITENVFRAVNIALVNELKVIYDSMGLDIWEVLDAAATKPFGFMRFNPGPGLGGHCIALDPFYLSFKARAHGVQTEFIELAGKINLAMPTYVVRRLGAALAAQGLALRDSHILVLGVAYKADVDDTRESPAFAIVSQLLEQASRVSYHDPHVAVLGPSRSWPGLPALRSEDLTREMLANADAVVVVTDHVAVDYSYVLEHAKLIVDTRGVYRTPHPKVFHA